MNSDLKNQKGVTAIIVTILMVVLIAFLGLAVDVGFMFMKRNELQNVADAAALSCVIKNSPPTAGCGDGVTQQTDLTVTTNDYIKTVNPKGYNVIATYPYVAPTPYASPAVSKCIVVANGCAKAVVSTIFKPFFMGVLGFSSNITIGATAVAISAGGNGQPTCLITENGFSSNGNKNSTMTNCSAAIGGSLNNTNKAGIVTTGAGSKITVYNNSSISCDACLPLPVISSASPLPPLINYSLPAIPGLSPTNTTCSTSGVCQPGRYNSKLILQTATVFEAGYYYLLNGLDTNDQNVSNKNTGGIGVTFYAPAGGFNLTGNVTLSAPAVPSTCTPGSGVLLYQPIGNTTAWSMGGSGNTINLTGIIYTPGVSLSTNGTPVGLNIYGSVIVNSVSIAGNGLLNITAPSSICDVVLTGTPQLVQ